MLGWERYCRLGRVSVLRGVWGMGWYVLDFGVSLRFLGVVGEKGYFFRKWGRRRF